MATRKSPSRGTASRPAKATTAIGKTRSAAKKPLKVSAKPATPEPESNVVPLTATETSAPEPAPVVEEVVAETVADTPKAEPVPVEDIAVLETAADEAPEASDPVEDVTVEETKIEATWPFGGTTAAFFQGFPKMPPFGEFPKMPSFGEFPKMPSFGEFPTFGVVDMNAYVASGTVLAEGMRSLGEEVMDFSRKTAERNVETTMAVFGASSIDEVIQLQSRHAAGSVDEMLNESAKLTGMAIDMANKAAAPFTRS